MVEDGGRAFAGEVEVGVVGEVDDGGLVGGGGVVDAQGVVVERVADVRGERAGEALVAVRADERESTPLGISCAVQTRLSKPSMPPWSVLGPSLRVSW